MLHAAIILLTVIIYVIVLKKLSPSRIHALYTHLLKRVAALLALIAAVWLGFAAYIAYTVPGYDLPTAAYWVVVTGLSLEPVLQPAGEEAAWLLLANGVLSFAVLAFVVTIIVETFMVSSMEEIRGVNVDLRDEDVSGHIVLIGWNPTAENVYYELRKILRARGEGTRIAVLDHPDKIQDINTVLKKNGDYGVGGDPLLEKSIERTNPWEARAIAVILEDDSKTMLALLKLNYLFGKKPPSRRVIVVAETMRDENERLLRSAMKSRGCGVELMTVITRSLTGRLLASSLFEPGVALAIEDITSTLHGVVKLVHRRASQLGVTEPIDFPILFEKAYMGELGERSIVVAVVKEDGEHGCGDGGETRLRHAHECVGRIEPGDELIMLMYRGNLPASARRSTWGGSYDVSYSVNESRWMRGDTPIRLRRLAGSKGHITVLGWNEAAESLVEELTRRRTSHIELGEAIFDKTIIVLSRRKPPLHREEIEDVISIRGDPANPDDLERSGLLRADAIVLAMGEDHTTTYTALVLEAMLREKAEARRARSIESWGVRMPETGEAMPVIVAETMSRATAEILLAGRHVDVAVPTRDLGGRLIAYAIQHPLIYHWIEDVLSAYRGRGDLKEIYVQKSSDLIGFIGKPYGELFKYLYREKKLILLAAIIYEGNEEPECRLVFMPSPSRPVGKRDRLIVLGRSEEARET